jgi:hypothetical protein
MGELTEQQRAAMERAAAIARLRADMDANPRLTTGQAAPAPFASDAPDWLSSWVPVDGQPITQQERDRRTAEIQNIRGDQTAPFQAARSAFQGVTFGAGDEALAGINSLTGFGDYGTELERERAMLDQFRSERPVMAYGSEIAGALANPAGMASLTGGLGMRAAQSAGLGAILSGLYGFNAGEGGVENRLEQGAASGLFGGAIGGAIPVVGAGIEKIANQLSRNRSLREAFRNAPDMAAVRTRAEQLYNQADQAAPLPRSGFAPVAQGAIDDAQRLGLDDMLTPNANRVADRLTDAATSPDPNIGMRELDILRRQAAIPAGDVANRPQAAIGSRMIQAIDDFIDATDPGTAGALREARDMWARLRRSEVIENAIERAGRQATGFENGIRVQFRQLLNNPRAIRGFTQAERDAIEAVVKGTPVGNALRLVGKLGYDLQANTNALGATLGMAMGTGAGAVLGPGGAAVGAIALPAVASMARAGAARTTETAARAIPAMIAGNVIPAARQMPEATRNIIEALMRRQTAAMTREADLPAGLQR